MVLGGEQKTASYKKNVMKTLYLLRHAKSSWKFPELTDQERPLNSRGKRDAPIMGNWLKEQGMMIPDRILSSPAVRTLATISRVGHALGLSGEAIETEAQLYHAAPHTLLNIIRSCSQEVNSLMLVGHNPGLTELVNHLCPTHIIANIPTCGVYAIQFRTARWKEAGKETARFLAFQYPKKL
jgi:phosphohistidine phosphatase